MQILRAKWLIKGGENLQIIKDGALAFSEQIHFAGRADEVRDKFKNASVSDLGECVLAPAFVNAHTHLEFSACAGELSYGGFLPWLADIVQNGAKVRASKAQINKAIRQILTSGTASIGAISSFGIDMSALSQSPLRVLFFNEILGSSKNYVAQAWRGFLQRFNASLKLKSKRFVPAISPHAPYSVHKDLLALATDFARSNGLICSTHFMESKDEQLWLESAKGGFKKHLLRFNPAPAPMYSPSEYVACFKGLHTLFTHCVFVRDFSHFDPELHHITHCLVSNRLLGSGVLGLERIRQANLGLSIGTDGLSSNFSLSMLDELRCALMAHANSDLHRLAKNLYLAATLGGARALGLNSGELEAGKEADIAVFKAPNCDEKELITKLILNSKKASTLYIAGQRVL